MLSDGPQPDDLPSSTDEPYAAVPASYRPFGSEVAGSPDGASGGSSTEQSDAVRGPGARRVVSAVVSAVVAAVVVVALLGAVGLVAWRAGLPAPTPAARPVTSGPSSPSLPTSGTTTGPTSTDHPAELTAYYTQALAWAPCPGSPAHQCARIEVPVDYAEPGGKTFELALRKVPALDPAKRVGSLLLNPGGPGASGLEYAQYSSFLFSKQVREAYDIIGFDPRGIGASDAVACLSDEDMDLLVDSDPTPDSAAERRQLLADVAGVTEHCAIAGGERALHMSSTEVARDMDVIRALVGDEKLSFFGASYGTFLGALYADLFPQRVGRFVLDSAVSPNQTEAEKLDFDIEGFESSMDAFVEWCVARDDCALGNDPARAADRVVKLLDTVERRPLETTKGDLDSIGEGWLGFAIFMCLYSESTWPTLNRGLAEAFEGRGDILLAHAMAVLGRSPAGEYDAGSYLHAMIPVRCADWPRSDPAVLAATQRRIRAEHPLWARLSGELYDACAGWPGKGRTPSGRTLAAGAAPILVIGNLRDPATPIGGTRQLAEDLDSGILVTSDHDGHGTYYAGNSCVDLIVDGYLLKGTVPSSDRAC